MFKNVDHSHSHNHRSSRPRLARTFILCISILVLCLTVWMEQHHHSVSATTSECRHPDEQKISISKRPTLLNYDVTLSQEESLDESIVQEFADTLKSGGRGGGRGGNGGRGGASGRSGRGDTGKSGAGRSSGRAGKGGSSAGRAASGRTGRSASSRSSRASAKTSSKSKASSKASSKGKAKGQAKGKSNSTSRGKSRSRSKGKSKSKSKSKSKAKRKSKTKAKVEKKPAPVVKPVVVKKPAPVVVKPVPPMTATKDAKGETRSARSSLSREANRNVHSNPNHFHVTGPTDRALVDRQFFTGHRSTECVACQLDCLTAGSVFASCEKRFYYYGCQQKAPCYNVRSGRTIVETAIGICIDKNGCVLKPTGLDPKNGKLILDTIVHRATSDVSVIN
ncbi:hypothetical protein FDP41_002008 [Naegleria fowleri]|uniref:Uncharacterized protein n=1 Tax=Naegleria fowleri TaxID=5763 RepID=A0A6A5BZ25_NAEFO|nr:uncharacterized protein FDP41_002008 [Naegleria fowleri]KAF0978938.1 hypothetical protein FDP41_002008 [Naegleria fowleri]